MKAAIEIATDTMLIAMGSDLLYLFLARGWTESSVPILLLELAFLAGAVAVGMIRAVNYLRGL